MADQASTRRTGLLALGISVLVVGLVAAIGLWIAAGNRLDDAVSTLARAPAGCDTVLDFSDTGDFLLFVETRGEIEGIRGDCDVEGEYSVEELPNVQLSMLDPDGGEVDLTTRSGVDYDAAGYEGRSVQVAAITTTGDHVLRVESEPDAGLFVVAVGKDPGDGVGLMRIGALAAGLIGLTVGVVCIAIATRRREPAPTQVAGWPAAPAGWPQSPPGAPRPAWDGSPSPPAGPPQGWPSQPPVAPPPGDQPPTRPPAAQPSPKDPVPSDQAQPSPWDPASSDQAQPSPGDPAPSDLAQPSPWRPVPSDPAPPAAQPSPSDPASSDPSSTPPGRSGADAAAGLPGQPSIPGSPGAGDGASGDGERSPWAPPHDE